MQHSPLFWVKENALFFITINCRDRGRNQLAHDHSSRTLIGAWLYYRDNKGCAPLIIMLMPDHLHMLISFSWKEGEGMPVIMKSWKSYTAKQCGIHWQRDYFDHRIRNKEDFDQKWEYIINNPVKAGLITNANNWPHRWISPTAGQNEFLE